MHEGQDVSRATAAGQWGLWEPPRICGRVTENGIEAVRIGRDAGSEALLPSRPFGRSAGIPEGAKLCRIIPVPWGTRHLLTLETARLERGRGF